jgi:flagellar assembly factor FliW
MQVITSRFGVIEAAEGDVIRFPGGVIGFRKETAFVLIPHGASSYIAWLQSTSSPDVAFPVVSAHGFAGYPDVPLEPAADRAGLGGKSEELAVLAVLSAPSGQPATVNLLAPLVINSATRNGAQVFLEGSRFSTQELFSYPQDAQQVPPLPKSAAATSP